MASAIFSKSRILNPTLCRECIIKWDKPFCTSNNCFSSYWNKVYLERKKHIAEIPIDIGERSNKFGVFSNNEICLSDIKVYGFDYDYTLASYKDDLYHVLYDLGKESLIKNYKYPEGIREQNFNPEFILRGLHYDIRKGLLMKIDAYHNIQLGTVYRGTSKLSDREVLELYHGTHVPIRDMNTYYGSGPMVQLVDMFAPPEMNLITNVTDFFIENSIPYDPEYVFYDIKHAIQDVHTSGDIHRKITSDLGRFLQDGPKIKGILERLEDAGKRMFIITNSGFPFIDAGMKYMVGEDWLNLFDVVIVNARKPSFFNESTRPFRLYDAKNEQTWGRVKRLDKGQVYIQGNFHDFHHMTSWYGSKVLYFGDHVYTDLADPSLRHSWRTGAIIPELESEINVITSVDFKESVRWLIGLQHLLEEMQTFGSEDSLDMIPKLLEEREQLSTHLKSLCNEKFGSMFRTHHNQTYFSRRMARFADIYTSSLANLLQYSVDHTFYPRRTSLPHEPSPFNDPAHAQCVKSFVS